VRQPGILGPSLLEQEQVLDSAGARAASVPGATGGGGPKVLVA
jgi:hypothetical protein